MELDGLVEAVLVPEAVRAAGAAGFPAADTRLVAVVVGFLSASEEMAALGRATVALFVEAVEPVGDITEARAFAGSAGGLEMDEVRGLAAVDDARDCLPVVAGFGAGARDALRAGAAAGVREATVGLAVVVGAVVVARFSVDAAAAGLVPTALPDTEDLTPGAGLTDPAPNVPELRIWGTG